MERTEGTERAANTEGTEKRRRFVQRALLFPPPLAFNLLLGVLLLAVPPLVTRGAAQSQPGGGPLIDNERVTVLDMKVPAGGSSQRLGSVNRDVVVVSLGGEGASVGTVTFEPHGVAAVKALEHAAGSRAIVVELKDAQVPPLKNTSGFPNAFPRPGVKQLLDNARVLVWDYTWTAGVPTPMHFHDKDVVVTYLADGALESTTPDGQSVVNPHYFGFTKFNSRDRSHTEKLVKGSGRAIIVELK